jgi:hypothetical protein
VEIAREAWSPIEFQARILVLRATLYEVSRKTRSQKIRRFITDELEKPEWLLLK